MWLYQRHKKSFTLKPINSIEDMPKNTFGFIYEVCYVPTNEKYLGKKSYTLKSKLGEPSKITFISPYKIYIYKKSQLIITSERKFYINPKKNIVEKFDSQNCINK